jgi:hypothetical protein
MEEFLFFTTAEQEEEFDKIYKEQIEIKQKEIDELQKKTKKSQKHSAYAFVLQSERMFVFNNGEITLNGKQCPKEQVIGGKKYGFDPDFKKDIEQFLQGQTHYTVIFYPTGKYGPTVEYIGKSYEMPAKIILNDNTCLNVENEDKYSLMCL